MPIHLQHQTSIDVLNHSTDRDDAQLFTGASAVDKLETPDPEYSIIPTNLYSQDKFTVGWDCVRLKDQEHSQDTDENQFFFSVANPNTSNQVRSNMECLYRKSVTDSHGVSQEIASETLKQSIINSTLLDKIVTNSVMYDNQKFCLDAETGVGLPYLHERDKQFASLLSGQGKIDVFLPGYATGDRYTLIFTALIEPKLNISIAYSAGNIKEKQAAREAFDVIVNALKKNGETSPEKRLTLLEYHGKSLKEARESLDTPETKSAFQYVSGSENSPLISKSNETAHMFHISVTTEIINRSFQDENTTKAEKYQQVREKLGNLVSEDAKLTINALVDQLIDFHDIQYGDVALWIADREFANERESQAISRPKMFDLIADHLQKNNIGVYCIADTYVNRAYTFDGKEIVVNRHPYRLVNIPHIGRFWSGQVNGESLLAPREHQWYFMDQLLSKTGGRIVGIRSGALEPFALMGHHVIYLEHKGMFTPERHASWQGNIPYRRLITEKTTGYLNSNTEIKRSQKIQEMVCRAEEGKPQIKAQIDIQNIILNSDSRKLSALEEEIQTINEDIAFGVLSQNELQLLTAMLKSNNITSTAADVIESNLVLFKNSE